MFHDPPFRKTAATAAAAPTALGGANRLRRKSKARISKKLKLPAASGRPALTGFDRKDFPRQRSSGPFCRRARTSGGTGF